MTKRIRVTAIIMLAGLLAGCAGQSEHMRTIAADSVDLTASPGSAVVVFMRPSGMGFAVQSPVFEVTSGAPQLIGIVSAKTRVAHTTTPGSHRYMVTGENAAFMDAELLPGKRYHAIVSPQMGWLKARFALVPVGAERSRAADFDETCGDCSWVENTDSALNWAARNMASVQAKMEKYLPDYLSTEHKAFLFPDSGL